MKTAIMSNKMCWARKHLNTAQFLIIQLIVSSGLSLTCFPAEYPIRNKCCPKCPAGQHVKTDCAEDSSTFCLPCIGNSTYMDQPTGRRMCFTCASCDPGSGLRIRRSCTTTSNTICEPLEGFYCIHHTEDGCLATRKHTSCKPGQYIVQKGNAFNDTQCNDCIDGTFSDGSFTYCHPHKQCISPDQQIKPGTSSTDAECRENTTATVIGIAVCVVLIVIGIGVGIIVYLKRNKCFKNSTKRKSCDDAPKKEPLNGEETQDPA